MKAWLKRVAPKPVRELWHLFRRWQRAPTRLIGKAIRNIPSPVFVQIGSNDGVANDPVRELIVNNTNCKALLVEPVPFLFARLRDNYVQLPNVILENAAIAAGPPDQKHFYYLSPEANRALPELPHWFDQLGSFDRAHIFKHFGPEVEPFIVESLVPTLSLADLFDRHQFSNIDVLHIDAEGYDWEILRHVDLDTITPSVILFEHAHLTEEAKKQAVASLERHYELLDLGCDFFCKRHR